MFRLQTQTHHVGYCEETGAELRRNEARFWIAGQEIPIAAFAVNESVQIADRFDNRVDLPTQILATEKTATITLANGVDMELSGLTDDNFEMEILR